VCSSDLEDFSESAHILETHVALLKDKLLYTHTIDMIQKEQINAEWARKHGEAWDSSDREGLDFFEKKGGKVITLDAAESARWSEVTGPVVDSYSKQLDGSGVNGRAVFDFIKAAIAGASKN